MLTNRPRFRSLAALALLVVALAGCLPAATPPASTAAPTPHQAEVTPTAAPAQPTATLPPTSVAPAPTRPPAAPVSFAPYKARQVALPAGYQGYTLPLDLARISGLEAYELSAAQQGALEASGFFVVPGEDAEFFRLYSRLEAQDLPAFVTTDSVLHIYHLAFDKVLRSAERERFAPALLQLSRALVATAEAGRRQAQGSAAEEAATRALAYFSVALRLQDPQAPIPAAVEDVVARELALVEAHQGWAASPVMAQATTGSQYLEDYSQYVPRGHYTTSEALERYFRAMMWYGRLNFRVKDPEETRTALLIVQAMEHTQVGAQTALAAWQSIYQPTTFFVGRSDDLSIDDYRGLAATVYGSLDDDPRVVADAAKIDALIEAAGALPAPRINSLAISPGEDRAAATRGLRFMGQRFVVDAYIFDQLMYDRVGTMEKPRALPRSLDVAAAFGSEEAYTLLEATGETAFANYPEQMARLRGEIAALPESQWHENLYWGWLYTFQPLVAAKDVRYPAFMRTTAWARKDLQTMLGSWTELKHDTILYAKQAGGLGGAMPQEPPPGYVEPNPEVYARLAALAEQTVAGLEQYGLLGDVEKRLLTNLQTQLERLQAMAEAELAGRPLTNEELELIRGYGGWLRHMTDLAADSVGPGGMAEDPQAALVADVATAGTTVLEEATGRIGRILVAVPAGDRLALAEGGVYSYYEFPWPASNRLTDEKWREMLQAGQAPPPPDWTGMFTIE